MSGKLFIIATPIGNLKDITLRALEVFDQIDILACEDSRITGKLLHHYFQQGLIHHIPKYFVYNDYNAQTKYQQIINLLLQGNQVGLVSDAGTPLISDPGYRLLHHAYLHNIPVEILPGPSSVIQAVVASGLGGNKFLFFGFLSKKAGKRLKEVTLIHFFLNLIPSLKIVIFLSPHRYHQEIQSLLQILNPHTPAVLLRELTKIHQQRISTTLQKLTQLDNIKGELILVLTSHQ